jgi:catalase
MKLLELALTGTIANPALAQELLDAEAGDDVADASVTWPGHRTQIPFGKITLTARVDDQVPERRKIIFDPLPRVEGIDSSGDPLTQVRADIYLLSGRRRRAFFGDGRP